MRSPKPIAVLAACLALATSGCIGQFALTKEVRKFNLEQTSERWGREILFVILYVIPVYPFANFLDLIVFNSIEFWQGKNPINGEKSVSPVASTRRFEQPDGSVLTMSLRDDRSIDIEAVDAEGRRHFVNLMRAASGVVARDRSRAVLGASPGVHGSDVLRGLEEHRLPRLARSY